MKSINFFTLACLFFVQGLWVHPCFAEKEMSLETLLANMQKAVDSINDLTFTLTISYGEEMNAKLKDSKFTNFAEHHSFKKPYWSLSVGENSQFLYKQKGDKKFEMLYYSIALKKITRSEEEIPQDQLPVPVPFLGQLSYKMNHIKEKPDFTLEQKNDLKGSYFLLTLKQDQSKGKTLFYIREADWLIFKMESFENNRLVVSQEASDVKINSGLKDEVFKLNVDESIPIVEKQTPKVESVEITHWGAATPDMMKNKKETACPACGVDNMCAYLSELENVPNSEIVPGILKSGFGLIYKVRGTSQDAHTMLKANFIYPPMTNPLTGEVKTREDGMLFADFDKPNTTGWTFGSEWEIVPGEWTIQILEFGKDKVLAEKRFTVTKADDIYAYLGKNGKMIKELKEAIAKNPNDAMMAKTLGNVYLGINDFDDAILQYNKAIELQEHPHFYNNRCSAWNEKKEYDKALVDCNKALTIDPQYSSAFVNRGNTFRYLKEYHKAIEDYNRSLRAAPPEDRYNPPMAYYNRAGVYKEQGKLDQAISDYSQAIKYNASNALYYFSRGDVYEAQGNLTNAKMDYEKTLQLDPNDSYCRDKLEKLQGKVK